MHSHPCLPPPDQTRHPHPQCPARAAHMSDKQHLVKHMACRVYLSTLAAPFRTGKQQHTSIENGLDSTCHFTFRTLPCNELLRCPKESTAGKAGSQTNAALSGHATSAPVAPALEALHPLWAGPQAPDVALAWSVQECPAGPRGQAAPARQQAAAGLELPVLGCPAGLQPVASQMLGQASWPPLAQDWCPDLKRLGWQELLCGWLPAPVHGVPWIWTDLVV